jgi:voltage-gated potassium channel Kch
VKPVRALKSAYAWLLAGLVGAALFIPFVQRDRLGAVLLHAMMFGLIAMCVTAVAKNRRQVAVSIVLAIPAVILTGLGLMGYGGPTLALRHAIQTAFFAHTTMVILSDVARDEKVSAEKIRGAVCGFFLLGATWAFGYLTLLEINPDAISFTSPAAGRPWIADILYFSYITLTTVGYGDIAPVSPLARSMAWLEAMSGQLYLTGLLARLVGIHITRTSRRHES